VIIGAIRKKITCPPRRLAKAFKKWGQSTSQAIAAQNRLDAKVSPHYAGGVRRIVTGTSYGITRQRFVAVSTGWKSRECYWTQEHVGDAGIPRCRPPTRGGSRGQDRLTLPSRDARRATGSACRRQLEAAQPPTAGTSGVSVAALVHASAGVLALSTLDARNNSSSASAMSSMHLGRVAG
jgi:hypothetical protein